MRSRRSLFPIVPIVAVLCLLIAAQTAAGERLPTQPFTESASGLTIDLPTGWTARPAGGNGPSLVAASDEAFFGQNPPAQIATTMIYTSKVAEFGGPKDPKALADFFSQQMTEGGQIEKASRTGDVTIGGLPGAAKKVRGTVGGKTGLFTFAAVVGPDSLAILVGIDTTGGDLDKAINAIATSMRFASNGGGGGGGGSAAGPDLSPEETEALMKDFLSAFQGDSDQIDTAFQKYAAKDVDDPDSIAAYNLERPEILGQETVDGMLCFSARTKAGVTLRTWQVCWRGGKIRSVKQTAMDFDR